MNTIGDRIKFLRKKEGLNQIEFCKKINLSQGRLSEIEKGKNNPSYETLESIKSIFNISLDWLVTGEYSKTDIEVTSSSPQILSGISNEEMNLLELYRKLSVRDQIKIEGIIENKIAESQDSKRGTSSTYQNGEEVATLQNKGTA